MASLYTRSRACIQFGPVMQFSDLKDADEITRLIRGRIATMSGWPTSDATADEPAESPPAECGEASPARPTMSAHDRLH